MGQLTVEALYKSLGRLVKAGQGNKKIVISDDNEGNGYHGCFFATTSDPKAVSSVINLSNGLNDSEETDCKNIVIIG